MSRLRYRSRRHEIAEAEAHLARRKRVVIARSLRIGEALREKLTEPGAFIIAGSAGYMIGEFSRPRAVTDQSSSSSRTSEVTLEDAAFWIKTALALISWGSAVLATSEPDQET